MKKIFFNLISIAGLLVMLTSGVSAASVLSKISTMVIIFTSVAGAAVWAYAIKKRKEMDE